MSDVTCDIVGYTLRRQLILFPRLKDDLHDN